MGTLKLSSAPKFSTNPYDATISKAFHASSLVANSTITQPIIWPVLASTGSVTPRLPNISFPLSHLLRPYRAMLRELKNVYTFNFVVRGETPPNMRRLPSTKKTVLTPFASLSSAGGGVYWKLIGSGSNTGRGAFALVPAVSTVEVMNFSPALAIAFRYASAKVHVLAGSAACLFGHSGTRRLGTSGRP
jgi:hypothetical protein